MIKRILSIIAITLILSGCGTTTSNTKSSVAMGADELDTAIREASDYLNTKIPNGNKVAFINISGGFPDFANYILNDLSRHGVNDGIFSVVDRAQLDAVRAELNFNMSGEVSDQSAQAIGQMLGAQTIVSGSVQRLGTQYRLDVKAIEVQTASVQGQWGKNIPHGATIATLTGTTASGTSTMASGGTTATTSSGTTQATAPARAAAGTYYFHPRIQVYQSGVPSNTYIDRIVVRGNFMTFYLTETPTGFSSAGNPWVGAGSEKTILQDLNNSRRTWQIVNHQMGERYDQNKPSFITFENVTATRFTMINNNSGYGDFIFEEIDLTKAEFEP